MGGGASPPDFDTGAPTRPPVVQELNGAPAKIW